LEHITGFLAELRVTESALDEFEIWVSADCEDGMTTPEIHFKDLMLLTKGNFRHIICS
jgi:hypothetical protein